MQYAFTTAWDVDAPIDEVWRVIYHADGWPAWWKHVKRVTTLSAGDERGVGRVQHHEWSTALPYRLVFDTRTTRVEPPRVLEADATGQLVGTGRWALRPEGRITVVRYEWHVRTTTRWMNLLAPLLRPAFAWNHRVVMDEGGRALARRLGTTLAKAPVHILHLTA